MERLACFGAVEQGIRVDSFLVIETRERENLQTQTRPTRAQRVRSDKYRAKTTESPIRDILNFRRFP
jgi:hypothetical protein